MTTTADDGTRIGTVQRTYPVQTEVGILPDTFIIGAPKSGTTYLASWLGASPEVYAPPVKEPGFFMEQRQYGRGLGHCAAAYYSGATDERVVLDATPWYLYPASVPLRVAGSLGTENARIIAVLREPVARAVSMYHDQHGRLRETRSLAQAFADELAVDDPESELAREAGPDLFRHYLLCGRYAEPLGRWLDVFGRESVCVLLAEEMWGDPAGARARLESFLGVSLPEAPPRAANAASRAGVGVVETVLSRMEASTGRLRSAVARVPGAAGRVRTAMDAVARWNQVPVRYPTPDPLLLSGLREWFSPANHRLEELIGRSLEAWR